MSSPAALIATAKVRAGSEDAFAAWKARHDAALAKFPGFISSDIMPPDKHSDMWTIILNFRSTSELTAWQQSKERAAIIGELLPLVAGGNFGEVMNREASDSAQPETTVTQVILSQVKPGMEDAYREWCARIQDAQARYPGYRGMYLQPPASNGGHWTTMLRFDTTEHLEGWLAARPMGSRPDAQRALIPRLRSSLRGRLPFRFHQIEVVPGQPLVGC